MLFGSVAAPFGRSCLRALFASLALRLAAAFVVNARKVNFVLINDLLTLISVKVNALLRLTGVKVNFCLLFVKVNAY